MITNFFLVIISTILELIFGWFHVVDIASIPLIGTIASNFLIFGVTQWNALLVTVPYFQFSWHALLWVVLPFEFLVLVGNFFFGARFPIRSLF